MHALADATRRDIIRRSIAGRHSVSALARHYPISTTAVQKHVAVLEQAGLVSRHKVGREQRVRTEIAGVRAASSVLDDLEALWRARIDQIDDLLAEPDRAQP